MADFTSNAYANVYVNNEQARSRLAELTSQAGALRKKLDEARLNGDVKGAIATQKELNKIEKEAQNVVKAYFDVDKVMKNLSKSGMNDLRKALAQLTKEINSGKIARGSRQWDEHVQKIRTLKKEMEDIDSSMRIIPTRWQQITEGFNRNFATVSSIVASVTGLSYTFKKSYEDYAHLEDVYSDVMKTTGLTREQVVELNKDFQNMDTRTAREELNKLAADAGKLGITSKQDVLDFVEAGNMINVALGEDLGDDAIKNIGKLTFVYSQSTKEMKDAGLKENMLAVGSAINSLGQSSTASEQYLVDFAQRIGGIGSQAGLSLQNILGYASALDQAGEKTEMSATAFGKFIMEILKKPAVFAKAAGQDVKQFSELMKTDMNAAILSVLQGLQGKGGLESLLPVFKDMGLNAARAAEVVSALAGKVEEVRKAQEISHTEFAKGTSIMNEYNTKNNNAQANLEKARNSFLDASVALGERLNPLMLQSTNRLTYVVKILPPVIDFVSKYAVAIGVASAAILVYSARTKIALAATSIHYGLLVAQSAVLSAVKSGVLLLSASKLALTGNTAGATVAMRAFNMVVKANPLGIFLTVLTAVVGAIVLFTGKTSKSEESLKEFNAKLVKEEVDLKNIFKAYKNANEGTAEKDRLLGIIKEKYGDYIQHLIDEKGNITDIAAAQQLANEKLQESIALKFRDKTLSELQATAVLKQRDELKKLREKLSGINFEYKDSSTGKMKKDGIGEAAAEETVRCFREILSDETKTVETMRGDMIKYLRDNFEGTNRRGFFKNGAGFLGFGDSVIDNMDDLIASVRELRKETKETQQLYKPFLVASKSSNILPEVVVTPPKKTGEDGDTNNDDTTPPTSSDKSDPYKKKLADLEKYINEQRKLITQDRMNGVLTQEEYNRQLEYLEQERLNKLVEIYGLEEKEGLDAQDKIFRYRAKMQDELFKQLKISADEIGKINEQSQSDRIAKAQAGMNKLSETLQQQQVEQAALEAALTEVQQKEWEKRIEIAQFSIDSIQEIMGGLSSYMQAENEAEVATVNRKYDKQIQAAGKNERKVKKLEEQRKAELNEINRKNADSSFKLQVAQALAPTAQAAINAYMSTAAVPLIGPAVAPIAAAVATAAGLLQVAAIKKQHDAAMQEFYAGGYTMPGVRRRVCRKCRSRR
jgi:TP901 family phage tail tape measure protein